MDRPVQTSDGIPLPRFRTVLLVATLALVAWIVWGVADSIRARRALMDPSAPTLERTQAVERWAILGRPALPELTEALKAEDAKTRELALLAIAQIGPGARETGPEVARLLADPSENVRLVALDTLAQIGHPLEQELPAIVAFLSAEDGTLREDAADVLENIGAPAIPLLLGVTDSPKPEARKHAIALLGRLGKGNPQVIAAVHRTATDPDDQVRALAYRVLIFWNELTLDEAIAGLRDASPQIASDVASTAEHLSEDAEALVPDLIRLFDRDDTKCAALQGLWALGPAARSAAPHVVTLLETEQHQRHVVSLLGIEWHPDLVLDVLGKFGAEEERLAPHVEPYLFERSYGDSCRAAANALKQISPEAARAAVPELIEHLRRGGPRDRVRAAAALSGLGTLAEQATPALIGALSDAEEWARIYAARALGKIGPPAAAAVPALLNAARDQSLSTRNQSGHGTVDGTFREAAIRALGLIGTEASLAVPVLVKALGEGSDSVCAEAALALGRLRADAEAVVPALESLLLSDHYRGRKAAALALGNYGPEAQSAVPILVGMIESAEEVRLDETSSLHIPIPSKWMQEYFRITVPLTPLDARSEASFATEALRKIDPEALRQAGIDPEALSERR